MPELENEEIQDNIENTSLNTEVETAVAEADNDAPRLPDIVVTDRPFRDFADESAAALEAASDRLRLYRRGNQLSVLTQDEDGRPVLEPVKVDKLSLLMSRAANFRRLQSDASRAHVRPPADVLKNLLTRHDLEIPVIKGIAEAPTLRPDGTILLTPGYDPATGLYYQPAGEIGQFAMPVESSGGVRDALAVVEDILADFPFEDQASKANAIAFLLTPIVRPAIPGCVPLALINGTNPGTGKGLLTSVASIIANGAPASVEAAPSTDDEFRKKITAALRSGRTLVVWDNLRGTLKSPALEAALTSPMWADRILGASEDITLPQRATWAATGNNISLGSDMTRRCYHIRFVAKSARPWQRQEFRHPELLQYVRESRGQLLISLLTIARAWFLAGCPRPDVEVLGTFEAWTRIIGGMLQNAGVEGFLENLPAMYDQADDEEAQWEPFLRELRRHFGRKPFTVSEIFQATADPSASTSTRLKATIPDSLAGPAGSQNRRLGKALAARRETRYGDDGIHLSPAGHDPHTKAARWKICTDSRARLMTVA